MSKIFYNQSGAMAPYPSDRDTALRLKTVRYDDGIYCPVCEQRNAQQPGNRCSIKYAVNERCVHCARIDAMHFYNHTALMVAFPELTDITDTVREALREFPLSSYFRFPSTAAAAIANKWAAWVRVDPCRRAGHIGIVDVESGECWFCVKEREATKQSPRAMARKSGQRWYTPLTACPECNTKALRRVHDDLCAGCRPSGDTSPRQAALASGDRWYTPDTPCKRCGTMSPKMVANGQCSGCTGEQPTDKKDGRSTPDAELMRAQPDMLIERTDARLLGMRVYRTGRACQRGHTGFRYVSTGSCIDCLRG